MQLRLSVVSILPSFAGVQYKGDNVAMSISFHLCLEVCVFYMGDTGTYNTPWKNASSVCEGVLHGESNISLLELNWGSPRAREEVAATPRWSLNCSISIIWDQTRRVVGPTLYSMNTAFISARPSGHL